MKYATDRESLERVTKVDFFRGSGPGGQRRNKVETGVRLFHPPSDITIEAVGSRSQAQNREVAFGRLKERLEKLNRPKKRRLKTRVPRAAKERRLKGKRARSKKKQERQQHSLPE